MPILQLYGWTCMLPLQSNRIIVKKNFQLLCTIFIQCYIITQPTRIVIICRWHIFCRKAISCVADDKRRFANSTIADKNTLHSSMICGPVFAVLHRVLSKNVVKCKRSSEEGNMKHHRFDAIRKSNFTSAAEQNNLVLYYKKYTTTCINYETKSQS